MLILLLIRYLITFLMCLFESRQSLFEPLDLGTRTLKGTTLSSDVFKSNSGWLLLLLILLIVDIRIARKSCCVVELIGAPTHAVISSSR